MNYRVLGAIGLAGIAGAAIALAPTEPPPPPKPPLTHEEIDQVFADLAAATKSPEQKASLLSFQQNVGSELKRKFLAGEIPLTFQPKGKWPGDISVIVKGAGKAPVGGHSCKQRKICVVVRCVNGFDDVNACVQDSMDCTDYSSGNC